MHSIATTGDSTAILLSRPGPGCTILEIHGELDLAATDYLRERMLIALRRAATHVVVDLSGVTFCDASGLAMLVHVDRRARLLGLGFSLAAPSAEMSKIMQITGLQRHFTIHPAAAV